MRTTSFGKYFDDQRDRIVAAMQNKNTQLWKEWRERYDEREKQEQEERMKKELEKCSEKGVEISQECKTYYKKKFEIQRVRTKTMTKKKQILKILRENGDGELYLEFSKDELNMMGLERGDMVEWMQLEDREVWKKVTKKKWSI